MRQNSWNTTDTYLQCQSEYQIMKNNQTEVDWQRYTETFGSWRHWMWKHLSIIMTMMSLLVCSAVESIIQINCNWWRHESQKVSGPCREKHSDQILHKVYKYLGFFDGSIHCVQNCYANLGRQRNYQCPYPDWILLWYNANLGARHGHCSLTGKTILWVTKGF